MTSKTAGLLILFLSFSRVCVSANGFARVAADLQQSAKVLLGTAAGFVACQSVFHFIHGLLRCFLDLAHHLIEPSLSFQPVVPRQHARCLFNTPFDLVGFSTTLPFLLKGPLCHDLNVHAATAG
jgi:hypothetical protein